MTTMPHLLLGVRVPPEYVQPLEQVVLALRESHPGKSDHDLLSLVVVRGICSLRIEVARQQARQSICR